jgi:hypothetical protein
MKETIKLFNRLTKVFDPDGFYTFTLRTDTIQLQGRYSPELSREIGRIVGKTRPSYICEVTGYIKWSFNVGSKRVEIILT